MVHDSILPVVLSCYADWCDVCKKLEPILVQRMQQYQGKIKFIKLNIDEVPQAANELQVTHEPNKKVSNPI